MERFDSGLPNTLNVAHNLTLCSVRGVRRVALDPSNPKIVYASAYAKGVWRSNDGGNTWAQIFLPIADPVVTSFTERPEIAVTKLPNGNTRMYLVIGQVGAPPAKTFLSNNVAPGTPNFILLTSKNPALLPDTPPTIRAPVNAGTTTSYTPRPEIRMSYTSGVHTSMGKQETSRMAAA